MKNIKKIKSHIARYLDDEVVVYCNTKTSLIQVFGKEDMEELVIKNIRNVSRYKDSIVMQTSNNGIVLYDFKKDKLNKLPRIGGNANDNGLVISGDFLVIHDLRYMHIFDFAQNEWRSLLPEDKFIMDVSKYDKDSLLVSVNKENHFELQILHLKSLTLEKIKESKEFSVYISYKNHIYTESYSFQILRLYLNDLLNPVTAITVDYPDQVILKDLRIDDNLIFFWKIVRETHKCLFVYDLNIKESKFITEIPMNIDILYSKNYQILFWIKLSGGKSYTELYYLSLDDFMKGELTLCKLQEKHQ